jgi:peptidoglycan/LPS O-acetylase OafA/YrhL
MKELKALTGLRGVAALWVLFFHSSFRGLPHMPGFVGSLIGSGYAAVSLFFVLSGFILTYNYLPRERSQQPFLLKVPGSSPQTILCRRCG